MKRLLPLALITLLAGLAVARRRRRLSEVAPELQHPQLMVPMSLRSDSSLRTGRRLVDAMSKQAAGLVVDGVDVRTEMVPADGSEPPVRTLVYEPTEREPPSAALIWLHGGGLVMGRPEMNHPLCSRIAKELSIVVLSVDYRLAPEHPFPAGLDDSVRVLAWAHQNAEQLGIDPERIAVGGGSAGGGLAACVAQVANDRGDLPVRFQLLQYPMLDDRTPLRDTDALLWTNTSNEYAWTAYLNHPPREYEGRPYASAARRIDFRGLPAAWIGVGDIDLFHDECADYAARLEAAGVPVRFDVVPGMYHGAEAVRPDAPAAVDFIDGMIAALADGVGVSRN
ncbi:MAG: arylesterase [Acidimicrobiaceae bacterium]|nr:arylesterase [Acidimicrobiaceae bacterium]